MADERVIRVLEVRNRPVGFAPGQWGGALVAMERGYFPVSETGYRSLSGLGENAVTPEFLEAMAVQRDRERAQTLAQARGTMEATAERVTNYIHVSMAAERALQGGFFATDSDRGALWNAAYRLFGLIDTDVRFQPGGNHPVWNPDFCAEAMSRTRLMLQFLEQSAKGSVPEDPPKIIFAASAYLALPPRPAGEPVIVLTGITRELALGVSATTQGVSRAKRLRIEAPTPKTSMNHPDQQLGLFGDGFAFEPTKQPADMRRGPSV